MHHLLGALWTAQGPLQSPSPEKGPQLREPTSDAWLRRCPGSRVSPGVRPRPRPSEARGQRPAKSAPSLVPPPSVLCPHFPTGFPRSTRSADRLPEAQSQALSRAAAKTPRPAALGSLDFLITNCLVLPCVLQPQCLFNPSSHAAAAVSKPAEPTALLAANVSEWSLYCPEAEFMDDATAFWRPPLLKI